jgi:radical SAM family RiPP maturation amino acid epimerase
MIPTDSLATLQYRQIFARRTPEELHTLAHIKRFMELLIGDPKFRDSLRANLADLQRVTQAYRLDLDPEQMLPLFHTGYMKYRFSDEESGWPLAKAWDDYMREMIAHRDLIRETGDCRQANPCFHTWRLRQMRRADSELGGSGPSITHPIVAFELSLGCTVGCWFCGISADRFHSYFPYTQDNAKLWRGVLGEMVELFGMAAQAGFCYWATDPSDNPDYPKFIEDYYRITGLLPQTTTAAPLKNVSLTRAVLELFDRYRCVTNRFSILTLKQLHAVHAEFSPEELMGVELVLQNREALVSKATAGRAMERRQRLRAAGKPDKIALLESEDHATIACVTGFLINMVNLTIQLVTPTRASERWPMGYRIYGERRFEAPNDFRRAVEGSIVAHMPEDLICSDRVVFREDLTYHRLPDGFELHSRRDRTTVRGFPGAGLLGDLIAEGNRTAGEVHAAMVANGADILVMADRLHDLFAAGLLNEDPKLDGIGSRRLAENGAAAEAAD